MKAIWKFPFDITDNITIEMPRGAIPLQVAAQNDVACMWACVDTEAPKESRRFKLRGTGHNADTIDPSKHVGTLFLYSGALVFHMFDA